uniref:tRNA-specific adenosine deaminase 1 n=1 Tax=Labrus bergylta TaxID=56723 RepID=A0A3Q3EWW2_9LABR
MVDADEIAKLCYERFKQLPRRGKPEPGREWTLLAAALKLSRCVHSDKVDKEVVSLGTGTKCIGQTAMSPSGVCLCVCVSVCLYLTSELHRAVSGEESSVFCRGDERGKWKLQPGVSFIFFTSHTPCGDASIIPMADIQSQPCPAVTSAKSPEGSDKGRDLKRKAEAPSEERNTKVSRLEEQETAETSTSEEPSLSLSTKTPEETFSQNPAGLLPQVSDIHRTGAKCVPGGHADPLHPGVGYHCAGMLRVKPGRGERLSLSCSDKLALYFSTVVVGKCPYSQEVMQRALITRLHLELKEIHFFFLLR